MSTKVYIVSKGSYSDWHIKGIFSSKEKAEVFKSFLGDSTEINDIEEYEVDKEYNFPKNKLFYEVKINTITNQYTVCKEDATDTYQKVLYVAYGDNIHVLVYCWADDEEAAIKIASERILICKAENKFFVNHYTWFKNKDKLTY